MHRSYPARVTRLGTTSRGRFSLGSIRLDETWFGSAGIRLTVVRPQLAGDHVEEEMKIGMDRDQAVQLAMRILHLAVQEEA